MLEEVISRFFQDHFKDLKEEISLDQVDAIIQEFKKITHNALPFQSQIPQLPQFQAEPDVSKYVFRLLDGVVFGLYYKYITLHTILGQSETDVERLQHQYKKKVSDGGFLVRRCEVLARIIHMYMNGEIVHLMNLYHVIPLISYVMCMAAKATGWSPLYFGLTLLGNYPHESALASSIQDQLRPLWDAFANASIYYENYQYGDDMESELCGMTIADKIQEKFSPSYLEEETHAMEEESTQKLREKVASNLNEVLFSLQTKDEMLQPVMEEWNSILNTLMVDLFFQWNKRSPLIGGPLRNASNYHDTTQLAVEAMGDNIGQLMPYFRESCTRRKQPRLEGADEHSDISTKLMRQQLYV